ncbi:receptor like protein kinase S.2 [Typha latifolia]|uniref:receptor like protein kinase S.2 n=1 Tax=Typha latifolia TaxID=4733 RepID=UPI003C2E060C
MPLNRLCFILPLDDDEIERDHRLSTKSNMNIARSLWTCSRGILRWFYSRHLCGCAVRDADIDASTKFADIAGVNDHPNKKVDGGNPRIFSYSELYIATNGFSDKEVLGSGGFGRVYRGVLPSDGTVVAVKCVSSRGERFEKSFAAELVAVAQLRHRNLVRLRGWCVHDDNLLLVYDYMPNRSLDRLLFAPASSGDPLVWRRRRRIVSGLAAALLYLHEQLDTQIIHRDVKTSNVMLDSEYNARLGDFGLARWLEHSSNGGGGGELETSMSMRSASVSSYYQFRLSETSRIGGTIGYLPPESFQRKGPGTAKSDVFSFGIVVLEVATGRRAVDLTYPDEQIFMLDWVRRLSDENKLLSAGDHKLPDGSYPLSEMNRLIHLGLLCSLHDPNSRPNMRWVAEKLLETSSNLPQLPSFKSQPQYFSLSSSSSSTTNSSSTTTLSNSIYHTAPGTTIFLTADNGSGGCNGSGGSNDSLRSANNSIPNVDTARDIPFKEIVAITNNFSDLQMVAELDFGTGYHGYLENRIHVLVKRLGMKTCPALRGRFANELRNLGRLHHRHLVQLRGWCTEQGEMLVVYDYSCSSLLSHYLFHHHQKKNSVLSWRHRYNIVKSLASAVLYLHEEWDEQVIHRHITSSAVFLDPDMNPKLGCFALAEFLSRNEHGNPHVPTCSPARGIFGYMSPEYVESGEATTTADVYSFGVVVLEVVSGVMAVDFRSPEVLLVKKVWNYEARKRPLGQLVDRRLDGEFDHGELTRLVRLGIACTRTNPDARPSMKQIASILDGNDELLKMLGNKKERRDDWDGRNAAALNLIRRIQALGIQ